MSDGTTAARELWRLSHLGVETWPNDDELVEWLVSEIDLRKAQGQAARSARNRADDLRRNAQTENRIFARRVQELEAELATANRELSDRRAAEGVDLREENKRLTRALEEQSAMLASVPVEEEPRQFYKMECIPNKYGVIAIGGPEPTPESTIRNLELRLRLAEAREKARDEQLKLRDACAMHKAAEWINGGEALRAALRGIVNGDKNSGDTINALTALAAELRALVPSDLVPKAELDAAEEKIAWLEQEHDNECASHEETIEQRNNANARIAALESGSAWVGVEWLRAKALSYRRADAGADQHHMDRGAENYEAIADELAAAHPQGDKMVSEKVALRAAFLAVDAGEICKTLGDSSLPLPSWEEIVARASAWPYVENQNAIAAAALARAAQEAGEGKT